MPKKKKKGKKTNGGSPSFATLPGAPMRIPDGLIEGGRAGLHSRISRSSPGEASRQVFDPISGMDRLIKRLPSRTMAELQQQWQNVLVKIDTRSADPKVLLRFRQAVVDEWARRLKIAIDDPDRFEWPSTEVGAPDGSKNAASWHAEGMLVYLGYRVGVVQGVSQGIRRQILDVAFGQSLPPVNGPSYCLAWGVPGTPARLQRLAIEIARFARNAKHKKSADLSSAIADWEQDLNYLYRQYYVGKFHFGWPRLD